MDKRTKSGIIRAAKATLETAEFGLRDLINGPSNRKLSGLSNLVVFGRAVMHACIPADLDRIEPPQSLRNISKSYSLAFDGFGNYYWEVEFHDGSKIKYYMDLPTDIGSVSRYFPSPPKKHLGKNLFDNSIEKLSTLYIEYLRKMVLKAEKKFSN